MLLLKAPVDVDNEVAIAFTRWPTHEEIATLKQYLDIWSRYGGNQRRGVMSEGLYVASRSVDSLPDGSIGCPRCAGFERPQ